jgi:hypothetical protein
MIGSLKEELQGEKNQKMYPKTSFMYVFGIFYPHRIDKFAVDMHFYIDKRTDDGWSSER